MTIARVPGKVNLALCVGSRRADGYHELSSLYQAVSLYEEITASERDDAEITVQMTGEGSEELATDADNLAVRAALLLRERFDRPDLGVDLWVTKQVPMAGGMAGGSADAAAVLLACNQEWQLGATRSELSVIAAELGSDVPFLLLGGNALGTGRGERLRALPAEGRLEWVFALAPRGLSTREVYQQFDQMVERGEMVPSADLSPSAVDALTSGDAAQVAGEMHNNLQAPAMVLYPELAATLAAGLAAGALGGIVCGSGPTCAFLGADAEAADRIAVELAGLANVRGTRRAYGPVLGPEVL
ncbi:MAG: 4-(cytidine 5'-diphospho)-2-C-methyl-D-erythritol kinase [Brooklawnia sp.]|uniref:4-(cytidine 5'-diphospho)-2-C-methyl-D-erythritol kinase n=1 Tax=Brooklawnia sp. TaxID=2699740 RepID=UPI003C727D4B